MDAKTAMDIGMKIAEDHEKACLDIFRVKPDATPQEMLRANLVWLGTKIMRAICQTSSDIKSED